MENLIDRLPEIFDAAVKEIADLQDKIKSLDEMNRILTLANILLADKLAELQNEKNETQ